MKKRKRSELINPKQRKLLRLAGFKPDYIANGVVVYVRGDLRLAFRPEQPVAVKVLVDRIINQTAYQLYRRASVAWRRLSIGDAEIDVTRLS